MADYNALVDDIRGHLESALAKLDELEAALPVAEADIIASASADTPFVQQDGYTAQVMGTYTPVSSIPEAGIHGPKLSNGDTLRFGKVIDPADRTRRALLFQVAKSDPNTSGGKRAELSFVPNIEANKVYWIAFSGYVDDWGALSTSDDALFGTQVHDGDNTLGLSPSFALYTAGAGRHFRVQARYSTSQTPSQGNSVTVNFKDYPIPFWQWADFVFKFRHNTAGDGFLQAWMDGQLIADHHGHLGYNTASKDYAKFGYYNWTSAAMNDKPRKVLLRSPTIVQDPTGQTYTLEQISALL